jgi:hypothetical protein
MAYLIFLATVILAIGKIIDELNKTSHGKQLVESLGNEVLQISKLSATLPIKEQVKEINKRVWFWARILFIATILVSFVRVESLFLATLMAFGLFSIIGLSLNVVVETKFFVKFHAFLILLISLSIGILLTFATYQDIALAQTLTNLFRPFGINPTSSGYSILLIVAILLVCLTIAYSFLALFLGIIAGIFIFTIALFSVLFARLSNRIGAQLFRYLTAGAAIIILVTILLTSLKYI